MEEEPDMEQSHDLATVFDDHVAAEFVTRDLDAAMATMAPDPYVFHVPSMAGGDGHENVRACTESRPHCQSSERRRWWTS